MPMNKVLLVLLPIAAPVKGIGLDFGGERGAPVPLGAAEPLGTMAAEGATMVVLPAAVVVGKGADVAL